MNADALAFLAHKGFTVAEIVEFARLAERRKDPTNADRQARHRTNRKAAKVTRYSNGVTPSPNDIYSNPHPSPSEISNEISSPVAEPEVDPPLTPDEVLEAWNIRAAELDLPKAKMTDARRKVLRVRIRQCTTDDFTEAIAALGRSAFLRGENDRGWRADFDFFLQSKNFTKLIEGGYDRAAH